MHNIHLIYVKVEGIRIVRYTYTYIYFVSVSFMQTLRPYSFPFSLPLHRLQMRWWMYIWVCHNFFSPNFRYTTFSFSKSQVIRLSVPSSWGYGNWVAAKLLCVIRRVVRERERDAMNAQGNSFSTTALFRKVVGLKWQKKGKKFLSQLKSGSRLGNTTKGPNRNYCTTYLSIITTETIMR